MAKETKDYVVKVRVTKSEKEKIEEYCARYGWSISDFLRYTMNSVLSKER